MLPNIDRAGSGAPTEEGNLMESTADMDAAWLHEQGLHYLQMFQREQAWISVKEIQALQSAKSERTASRASAISKRTPDPYRAAKKLEEDWFYQKAVRTRNGYQLAANMYFNAAQSAAAIEKGTQQ